ncbi:hypothetical protein SLEP1_g20271 [Rubroshorea leprosula]|uniref:Uncharacterized protein n=1 Tax=Rubroshorea leprosula TaxID=152421 RepID=A0AAV5JB50_9ROSI|nr:hypothetical protein SLEP1_g20271 [Rubroshorea leprosula]
MPTSSSVNRIRLSMVPTSSFAIMDGLLPIPLFLLFNFVTLTHKNLVPAACYHLRLRATKQVGDASRDWMRAGDTERKKGGKLPNRRENPREVPVRRQTLTLSLSLDRRNWRTCFPPPRPSPYLFRSDGPQLPMPFGRPSSTRDKKPQQTSAVRPCLFATCRKEQLSRESGVNFGFIHLMAGRKRKEIGGLR